MTGGAIGRRKGRRASRILIGAVVVAAAAGSLAHLAGSPAFSSADEAAHVDYAFQVWHGQLPRFEDGLLLPTTVGARPPVQWVAQHPPLFYLLLAPVVGPLADAHKPIAAVLASRGIALLIAVATVFAAAWAARHILPRRSSGIRFAALTVMVCSPWFLRLGGSAYNDILLVLVVTCLFGVTARVIRHGAARFDWLWLSLVLACGALTRLAFVPLAVVCLGGLAAAQLKRGWSDIKAWVRIIGIPSVSAVAASGWFYLRNLELTGSIAGSHVEWSAQHLQRVPRSLGEVLSFPSYWQSLLRQYASSPEIGDLANGLLFAIPAVCGFLLASAFVVRGRLGRVRQAVFADSLLLGLAGVCIFGVAAQQALYVGTGGGANPRYFVPLLLLFSIAIAITLTSVKPILGPWLLAGWLALHSVDMFLDLRAVLAREFAQQQADLYPTVAWTGFGVHVIALMVALASFVVWTRFERFAGAGLAFETDRIPTHDQAPASTGPSRLPPAAERNLAALGAVWTVPRCRVDPGLAGGGQP